MNVFFKTLLWHFKLIWHDIGLPPEITFLIGWTIQKVLGDPFYLEVPLESKVWFNIYWISYKSQINIYSVLLYYVPFLRDGNLRYIVCIKCDTKRFVFANKATNKNAVLFLSYLSQIEYLLSWCWWRTYYLFIIVLENAYLSQIILLYTYSQTSE